LEFQDTIQWLVLGIATMVSLGVVIRGALLLTRRRPEFAWPTTEGFIRESRVEQRKRWAASIRYSYTFNGEKYDGTRIAPLYEEGQYRTQQQAESDRRRYPYGKTVTVYVNPENPADAVLEPQSGKGRALVHLLHGVMGLVVVLIILLKSQ
jgi:hypothetical protein